jgi:hypothetical protein
MQSTCRRAFLTTKPHRPRPFHIAILAAPRRSSRLLGAGRATGGDNHRSLRKKKRAIPNALRGRKMSSDDNSASESDETRSDEEVQGLGMSTSDFSFNFTYALLFLPVLLHL